MLDNFALIVLTKLDPISDKLLKASEIIELDITRLPIIIFITNNIILQIIPNIPPKTPYLSRTLGSLVFS